MRREDYAFVARVLRVAYERTDAAREREDIHEAHLRIEGVVGQLCSHEEYPWPRGES